MKRISFSLLFVFLYFLNPYLAFGQEAKFPLEEVAVSDNINVLDSTQIASLSKECKDFYRDKKIQIEIALIPVNWLGKLSAEQYSLQLAEKRKLGNKELDSGILVLVVGSPKDTIGRKVRIEVGYGLEDKLTDSKAKKIIDNYIVAYLKKGDYYEACHWGLWDIKRALENFDSSIESSTHSHNVEDKSVVEEEEEKAKIPWFYFALFTIIISFLLYGLGLISSKPRFFTPLAVYPACTALNYLVAYIATPIVLHIILFLLFSLFIPALMLYVIKLRYPHNEDRILSLNGLGVMMYLLTVVFLMIVGFYYQTVDNIGFFFGTVVSLFASIPLLILAEIAELEGGGGNFNSGGGSYSSGSNYNSSSGGGYSGGGSSSSSGGGGYSGGGGSFGGGGASGDW